MTKTLLSVIWSLALWFVSLLVPGGAMALPGATADGGDRFPFVVEIKLHGELICSGTVLYPRIVVTAAHCLQQKVYWRGGQFYVDEYFRPTDLSVSTVRMGRTVTYAVDDIAVSPRWRTSSQGPGSVERLRYDLALLVTKEPVGVGAPPNALRPVAAPSEGAPGCAASLATLENGGIHRGIGGIHRGMLVAFGGERCSSAGQCEDAGVRRYLPVVIREISYCVRHRRNKDESLQSSIWCMESGVMPGDSGGALLVEAGNGELRYVGVISAQQGLPPELSGVASWRRTLAAALDANLDFIRKKAEQLGYAP